MFNRLKIALAATALMGLTATAFADGAGSPQISDRYPHLERHSQSRAVEGRAVTNSTVPQTGHQPQAELTAGGF